ASISPPNRSPACSVAPPMLYALTNGPPRRSNGPQLPHASSRAAPARSEISLKPPTLRDGITVRPADGANRAQPAPIGSTTSAPSAPDSSSCDTITDVATPATG